jgi:hypothetical protein
MMSADLERRIARLEAIEAVRYAFHRYLHSIDNNRIDQLLAEVFTADAKLEIANYPPGSGQNLVLDSEDKIRAIYGPIKADGHRHNAANTSIVVNDDCTEAQLTSYFVTTIAWGNQGGIYEGTFVPAGDGTWKAKVWRVSSQWGWRLADTGMELPDPYLYDPPAVGTRHDGMQPK